MAITRVCYCTREAVKQALDIKLTARNDPIVDTAIQAAADDIDGQMHRVFFTTLATRYFDWPNWQATYPWKIYLDASEVANITTVAPVVTTGGNTPQTIPAANILWRPENYAPPYTFFELDRSTSSAFGVGPTPQRDVRVTALFGYQDVFTPAGALAAALTDTTGTIAQVTNGAAVGVGDVLLADTERMLVTGKTAITTGQSQQGNGASTNSKADTALTVTDGTKFSPQETVVLDTERMLIVDVLGNVLSVIRGWDGTTLAAHSGATVYALRQLTVTRGVLGSTPTTHSNGTALSIAVVPGLIQELAVAESLVKVTQKVGGYAAQQGSGNSKVEHIGAGLDDLRAAAYEAFGRSARTRSV